MALEAVDTVGQLEEKSIRLAGQISHLTQRMDARLPDLRSNATFLSQDKLYERLSLGPRNIGELFELLRDRAVVLRAIVVARSGDQNPDSLNLQYLRDETEAQAAELDLLRFGTRHEFFPPEILHQKEEEYRQLCLRYYKEVERKLISSAQDRPALVPNQDRTPDPTTIPQPPLRPSVFKPGSEQDLQVGSGEETPGSQVGVRFACMDGKKFLYDVTLPAGNTIRIDGKSRAKVLEVMLSAGIHLSVRDITEKGWDGPATNNIPTVHKALDEIAEILSRPGYGHVLDEDKVKGLGSRSAMGYLIKPVPRAEIPSVSADQPVPIIFVEPTPPPSRATPRTERPAPQDILPESPDAAAEEEASLGDSLSAANQVNKVQPPTRLVSREPAIVPETTTVVPAAPPTIERAPLPLGALVAPAPADWKVDAYQRPRPQPSVSRRFEQVMESPAYLGLRTWNARPNLSASEMVSIVCGQEGFDVKRALDALATETSRLLEKQRSGARLNVEELAIVRNLRADVGGKTDQEIVDFQRKIFELWFVDAEPPDPKKSGKKDEEQDLIDDLTPDLVEKARTFIWNLRSKASDGYVTKGVALKADGSFGPKKLDELQREGILRVINTDDRGRVYNILDLTKAHFLETVTAQVLGEIEKIVEQELTKRAR